MMKNLRRRNLLVSALCVALLAACAPSSSAHQSTDTIGPIGVTPSQGSVADSADGSGLISSVPVQAPSGAMARDDTGQLFNVTETVPDSASTAAPAEITDPRILFVGDSVSLGMAIGNPDPMDAFVQAIGWHVTLDGRVGRFTDEGIRVLQQRSSEIHQVLVLMLGNNYDGNQDNFRAQIAQILAMTPQVKRIIMFTVPLYQPKQKDVNKVLADAAAADPRLTLIDWQTASHSYKGALNGDGIHPTNYGAVILDEMLAVTLGPAPGGPADAVLPTIGDPNVPAVPSSVNTNKGENSPSVGGPKVTSPPAKPKPTTAPRPTTTKPIATTSSAGGTTTTSGGGANSTTTTAKTTTTTTTTAAATTTKAAATTTTAPKPSIAASPTT